MQKQIKRMSLSPQIEDTIQAIRDLYDLSLHFKINEKDPHYKGTIVQINSYNDDYDIRFDKYKSDEDLSIDAVNIIHFEGLDMCEAVFEFSVNTVFDMDPDLIYRQLSLLGSRSELHPREKNDNFIVFSSDDRAFQRAANVENLKNMEFYQMFIVTVNNPFSLVRGG